MTSEHYTMRVDDGHAHAQSRYESTSSIDYIHLLRDVMTTKHADFHSLNVHLPFEIQHPHIYTNVSKGIHFIRYGEGLKRIFGIPLYWENAPELVYRTWELKHGQTQWQFVPDSVDLTLDTGHAMLGASSPEDALTRIRAIIDEWGPQIKHIHLHENNLISDEHWPVGNIISPSFIEEITQNRTYIFEQGEIIFPENSS